MATRPAQITLTIYQGQTFDDEIQFQDSDGNPLDFTGMTARMQVRRAVQDATVITTFDTDDGTIEPLDDSGVIKFNVPAASTSALPAYNVEQCWVYDLELVDGSTVRRLMEGALVTSPEVTRT